MPDGKLRLPHDIRDLLEATYRERPDDGEPSEFWLAARRDRDKASGDLESLANDWTNIWTDSNAGSDDEEDAPTRVIRYPTLPLVLLRAPFEGTGKVKFWHGETLRVPHPKAPMAARLPFAKAVARNSVKVASWLLPRGEEDDWFPAPLQFQQGKPTAFGVVHGSADAGDVLPPNVRHRENADEAFLGYSSRSGLDIRWDKRPKSRGAKIADWEDETPWY